MKPEQTARKFSAVHHDMGWIIGTGENGFGALLRRGDYLFQAPLSYYSQAARWDLSPGYQNEDDGFNRVIQPGCIYCHSGRPQPIAGHDGSYRDPAFTQTSVGCENCHGPGAAHVDAMRKGKIARARLTLQTPPSSTPSV